MAYSDGQRVSVQSEIRVLTKEYEELVNGSQQRLEPEHRRERIDRCLQRFAELERLAQQQAAFSTNETVDEMTTLSLSLLTLPFYMGRLEAMRTSGVPGSDHRLRIDGLVNSSKHMVRYINLCESIGLIREEDVERRMEYRPLDRAARVESHRVKTALEQSLAELDGKIRLEVAKAKRMRRILREDGETNEPDPEGEEDVAEELIREKHLVFTKLCLEEAFSDLHANQRETELLSSLTDEDKRKAVDTYQAALHEERSHAPNLHFPAARRPELNDVYLDLVTGTVGGPPVQPPLSGVNYSILQCGHSQPLNRQQIREAAFQDRNQPTMTLDEFAQREMAMMAEQSRQQAEAQQARQEEDARLGEAGVEDREQQKAAAWDDWKDAHPANGISSKGNYT